MDVLKDWKIGNPIQNKFIHELRELDFNQIEQSVTRLGMVRLIIMRRQLSLINIRYEYIQYMYDPDSDKWFVLFLTLTEKVMSLGVSGILSNG